MTEIIQRTCFMHEIEAVNALYMSQLETYQNYKSRRVHPFPFNRHINSASRYPL